ncbi:MAG: cytochrome C [Deltaproteobacteria bacterium HGW-Deltaproteobacteria-21]|nr:MAG: cytochrome C [Deltaproteobacteria bacterium HGW-Deltaproteobacteria-21]
MEPRKERLLAYVIVIVLFLVGVVSYAAYPDRKPEQPPRIMLKNTAGSVLLDHKQHSISSGYAVPCMDCHHEMDDEKSRPQSCNECHTAEGEDTPKRSDAFHQLCKGCHEDGGIGPVECAGCHMM